MTLSKAVSQKYAKTIEKCTNEEIYIALLEMVKTMAEDKVSNEGKKKLYYISAEFLIGKLLSNNLINLGIYSEVKEILKKAGKDICQIEELEQEPSLGNGGLGRLAGCAQPAQGNGPAAHLCRKPGGHGGVQLCV